MTARTFGNTVFHRSFLFRSAKGACTHTGVDGFPALCALAFFHAIIIGIYVTNLNRINHAGKSYSGFAFHPQAIRHVPVACPDTVVPTGKTEVEK
jgi:hypothetical protein